MYGCIYLENNKKIITKPNVKCLKKIKNKQKNNILNNKRGLKIHRRFVREKRNKYVILNCIDRIKNFSLYLSTY